MVALRALVAWCAGSVQKISHKVTKALRKAGNAQCLIKTDTEGSPIGELEEGRCLTIEDTVANATTDDRYP